MKVYVKELMQFGDRTLNPGVHEVTPEEAFSLYVRGPVRPATSEEAEAAAANVEAAVEAAAPETADAPANRAGRRRR